MKYNILKLHEMETAECKLNCTDCYLKQKQSPNNKLEYYLDQLDTEFEVYTSLYLNHLDRDINAALKPSSLLQRFGKRVKRRILVIDSISAAKLEYEHLEENDITEVGVSIKQNKLQFSVRDQFKNIKAVLLFTVGIDTLEFLDNGIRAGFRDIELNIKKPTSIENMLLYTNLLNKLSNYNGLNVTSDPCIMHIANKRDCTNPRDNQLEITTFLESTSAYACMYPSTTCIMHNN